MNRILGSVLIVFVSIAGYAQNTRSTESPKPPRPTYQSQKKKEKKGFFAFLKKENKPKNEVAEFRARLSKVYKKKAKEEKKADKPQYSDSSYFGHKRPPKKRPVGKQKFCKVCKIKH
ncbi:MAG: hypothetical protein RIM99_19960 [Cyclobacteriaceae bacterium]